MIVLQHGKLNPDFLIGCATQNTRAFLRELFPSRPIKGLKHDTLLGCVDLNEEEISPDRFRTAIWLLMDGALSGSYHIMEMAGTELRQRNAEELLDRLLRGVKTLYNGATIETDQPLDARKSEGPDGDDILEVLYLGEAEAEVPESERNREEMIDGQVFRFKAYLVRVVPVISKITIGFRHTNPSVITRPIHRNVTPKAEIDKLHEWLTDELQCPVPPVGGVKEGISALFAAGRLEPYQLYATEEDGAKARYGRAPANQNANSREVEEMIKRWEPQEGRLLLDGRYLFDVDTGRAIFSFRRRVDLPGARNVIQTVLGAR